MIGVVIGGFVGTWILLFIILQLLEEMRAYLMKPKGNDE
jgi:hypothetical protein